MRERGSGSLFRERFRDRKTGQLKVCRTWMMKLWMGGKPLKRSARTTSRAVASKQLEQWKALIRQGTYAPDVDQTRFDELATLLIDEYRARAGRGRDQPPEGVLLGMAGAGDFDGSDSRVCPAPATAAGGQRYYQPRAGRAQTHVSPRGARR